jgi:hypothetical protein
LLWELQEVAQGIKSIPDLHYIFLSYSMSYQDRFEWNPVFKKKEEARGGKKRGDEITC